MQGCIACVGYVREWYDDQVGEGLGGGFGARQDAEDQFDGCVLESFWGVAESFVTVCVKGIVLRMSRTLSRDTELASLVNTRHSLYGVMQY